MKRTEPLVALALVAALGVAGCSNSDSSGSASSSTSASAGASASAGFDNADVTFAQSMIPHHRQAVVMATMARDHTSTSAVKRLAAEIKGAQGPEIRTMSGWLKDWGKKVPSGSMAGMSGMSGTDDSGGGMTGMMTGAQMKKLDATRGSAFDRMFLTMMIGHHKGAVGMAEKEQTHGKSPDALALAKRIEADQTAQIAVMRRLLTP